MNKKYLLGAIIVSLFAFGMVIPMVAASSEFEGKFIIPEEGVGIKTQSEISVYDEEEWEYWISDELHPDDIWGGDTAKEGAKSQSMLVEIGEVEEIDIYKIIELLADMDSDTRQELLLNIPALESYALMMGLEIDGQYSVWPLISDGWDFTVGDFSESPDDNDDEGFIFKNVQDVRKIYDELNMVLLLYGMLESSSGDQRFYNYRAKDMTYLVFADLGMPCSGPPGEFLEVFREEIEEAARAGYMRQAYDYLSTTLPYSILFGYLTNFAGIGWDYKDDGTPIDGTFTKDVDIDDEKLKITIEYNADDYLPFCYEPWPGYSWDGSSVSTFWVETANHDFDIVISFSEDTGTVSKVEFYGADGTLLLRKEGLPVDIMQVIPGYTIPILLGVAALAAIGVIFVIMKKRK